MINTIHPNMTIGEIVARNYRTADIFKRLDIDFCCGGKKTIEQVCSEKSMSVEALVETLEKSFQQRIPPSREADTWPLEYLVDHIENVHHRYVRENIPLIIEYLEKIARVHQERHPELNILSRQFGLLANDLLEHLAKEEQILFPYIRARIARKPTMLHSADQAIQVMENEHEYAGSLLENIRKLTNNYQPPEDACTSYRVAFDKLREFEEDLHWHIHLENNILFAKVLKKDAEWSKQKSGNGSL